MLFVSNDVNCKRGENEHPVTCYLNPRSRYIRISEIVHDYQIMFSDFLTFLSCIQCLPNSLENLWYHVFAYKHTDNVIPPQLSMPALKKANLCLNSGDDGDISERCGSSYISSFTPKYSDDEYMYVRFRTDSSNTGTGFRLYYQAVCKSEIKITSVDVLQFGMSVHLVCATFVYLHKL